MVSTYLFFGTTKMAISIPGILTKRRSRDIVSRWEGNPLIHINSLNFPCADIHNAAVIMFNNKVYLLITIEHLSGQRRIHLATPTDNGYFKVHSKALLSPSREPQYSQHESGGVMDARITFLDGVYYIMYSVLGDHGFRLGLAKTTDFKNVERIGIISEPDTKAGILFPAKVNGNYARLERPSDGSSIWMSFSPDLIHWGGCELIIRPRGGFWDSDRIGPGATPMEIEQGWLLIYYGVKGTSAGPIFRLGTVILEKDDPTKVVGRANIPILSPRKQYERIGDVPNIVYSNGAVLTEDGTLNIFYGAANSCICIGTTTVDEIVANCIESEQEY